MPTVQPTTAKQKAASLGLELFRDDDGNWFCETRQLVGAGRLLGHHLISWTLTYDNALEALQAGVKNLESAVNQITER